MHGCRVYSHFLQKLLKSLEKFDKSSDSAIYFLIFNITGDRGECVCDEITRRSVCRCKPGYVGEACECPTSLDTCKADNGVSYWGTNSLDTCKIFLPQVKH